MFTPPPSPDPVRTAPRRPSPPLSDHSARFLFPDASPSSSRSPSPPTHFTPSPCSSSLTLAPPFPTPPSSNPAATPQIDVKRRIGRRTTWTIVVVPLVLLIITFSTRYLSHPVAFDVLLPEREHDHNWSSVANWHRHKRHPEPDSPQSSGAISFPTPTSSGAAAQSSQPLPTTQAIPTVPASAPPLPTPFPQPLDTSLSQNFSTQLCKNFFLNMTQTEPFRECRPFSLLQRSSSQFLQQAQTNLSALNDIVWGTCNTDASKDTCVANIAWFRDALTTQCTEELSANNAMVVSTLQGLQAYSLMRDTACIVDPSTNAYCYIEAVHNTNPSDLYFYQLPLGIDLPPSTTPSCSACTKSVMQTYAQAGNLSALQETYNNAVNIADKQCGEGYVQQANIVGNSAAVPGVGLDVWSWAVVAVSVIGFAGGLW
ncbi:hypothetical protein EIP91_012406 [Steccherinum ochraceum]|uniref:DUF7729 domain-containing protein n=1 Tax=Steccherinum ochraceum TaxID=92696 RepID=A0A4R0RWY9_9APHY|nr:hypothetical protein EIP91_012406 [Steccherinum ochraceum]